MVKALPPQPHLDWLKKTAKERLVELRAADPAARLHAAQREVARDYGFASWRALKAHVDRISLDGLIAAAVAEGRADDLARLLDEHPDKLSIEGGQWKVPLLHLAASEGRLACVDELLRRGFDPGTRDRLDNATALHWAAQGGHVAVIDRLLAAGADVDGVGDAHEVGVIGWATCFRHVRREAAEQLLARGAKPTIFSAVALDRGDLVRALVEKEPAVLGARMSPFEQRRTPLHLAVLKSRPAMVRLLLELGADPKATDERGNTALNYVASRKDGTIADILVAAGADPAQRDTNRFESAIPILSVRSLAVALDYYVARLGFRREWESGEPPTFACVTRGEARLFISQHETAMPISAYVTVNDVDALFDEYRRRGAPNLTEPKDRPWGMREIVVTDADRNMLVFGSDAGVTTPSDED